MRPLSGLLVPLSHVVVIDGVVLSEEDERLSDLEVLFYSHVFFDSSVPPSCAKQTSLAHIACWSLVCLDHHRIYADFHNG